MSLTTRPIMSGNLSYLPTRLLAFIKDTLLSIVSKYSAHAQGIEIQFDHGSQSRSRPPTRRGLRQIGLGDSDRYRAIRAKHYIESSKNS